MKRSAKEDRYQHHDYYRVDDLLSEDHLLARQVIRDWVKREVSPIIEDYAERPGHGRNSLWGDHAGTRTR